MNEAELQNKKVLLFSQFFFGYEKKIKEKMCEMGAEADLFDEMSVRSAMGRALLKVSPKIFALRTKRYYKKILKSVSSKKYDYVLFIDAEMPSAGTINEYKEAFPDARFCLHLWDSVKNLRGIEKKFPLFDLVTSFDRDDADKYGLTFRPLFFTDDFRKKQQDAPHEYDLAFIGTIHSDRYRVIKAVTAAAKDAKVFIYPYLKNRTVYRIYKLLKPEFKGTRPDDFKYEPLLGAKVAEIVAASNVILDVQHPGQSGLTMRTLEMVGMEKRLITTNASIVGYDFYNPENVTVIDRNKTDYELGDLKKPYAAVPEEIYEKYSIKSWICDVLGGITD